MSVANSIDRRWLGPYVSPLPTVEGLNYAVRVDGRASMQRMDVWPGDLRCHPPGCRECWREQHWRAGQTHS